MFFIGCNLSDDWIGSNMSDTLERFSYKGFNRAQQANGPNRAQAWDVLRKTDKCQSEEVVRCTWPYSEPWTSFAYYIAPPSCPESNSAKEILSHGRARVGPGHLRLVYGPTCLKSNFTIFNNWTINPKDLYVLLRIHRCSARAKSWKSGFWQWQLG